MVYFAPDRAKAVNLDRRMRQRLADSLRHVLEQSGDALEVDQGATGQLMAYLEAGPVSPRAFALYYEIVAAITENDLSSAAGGFRRLMALPHSSESDAAVMSILSWSPGVSAEQDCYARFFSFDDDTPIKLLPPPADLAEAYRLQILEVLGWLKMADPELASEIGVVSHTVLLALDSTEAGYFEFGGSASFMLWGALLLNPSNSHDRLFVAERIVHESAHALLFGYCADGPLLLNPSSERHASPLRDDPRPLDGIFHATFVTARMHYAVEHLLMRGLLASDEIPLARERLAKHRQRFADGLAVLDKYADLTETGAAVLAATRQYMDGAEFRA